MSKWDSFGKLTKLDFDYNGIVSGVIPKIYANSRNQVEIIISVRAEDNKNKPLSLTRDDFCVGLDLENNTEKALLYLCDSITGEKFSAPWKLSDEINDYTKAVNHDGQNRAKRDIDDILYIHAYLSCVGGNITKNFSVGIHIPGIGDFNTSKNGTSTKNGPKGESGSVFKPAKFLTISTLHPINYSHSDNIDVQNKWVDHKSFTTVARDISIVMKLDFSWLTIDQGTSKVNYLTIKPKNGIKFKNKKVIRNK